MIEILRRFIASEAMPDYRIMIGISILALIANSACLYLLQKSKKPISHQKGLLILKELTILVLMKKIKNTLNVIKYNERKYRKQTQVKKH
ncbi:hypothetical protein [Ancylomarina longa]|uniref:hypothetical protein n=1 Tax=Ancylomarina longa TaxID=2487017 RepID=UPI001ADE5630|nr:hypothetical protein [Ancylomarina longa]